MGTTALQRLVIERAERFSYLPESKRLQAEVLSRHIWWKIGGRPTDSLKLAIAITLEESRI